MKTFGVLYSVETGRGTRRFKKITNLSASTVKKHCPVIIHTDVVDRRDRTLFAIKFEALKRPDFDITLMLDGDTLVLDPNILNYEHFDKLLGDKMYGVVTYNENDMGANRAKIIAEEKKDYPLLPRYANAGVIAIRKEGLKKFREEWLKAYEDLCIRNNKPMFDEPSFNCAIQLALNEETAWLPKKYNIKNLKEDSKIYHAFGMTQDKKVKKMRKIIWDMKMKKIKGFFEKKKSPRKAIQ